MALHLYCPPNKQSKAYLVIDNVRKGWPDTIDIKNYARTDGPGLFWGFVGENMTLIKDLERRNKDYYLRIPVPPRRSTKRSGHPVHLVCRLSHHPVRR